MRYESTDYIAHSLFDQCILWFVTQEWTEPQQTIHRQRSREIVSDAAPSACVDPEQPRQQPQQLQKTQQLRQPQRPPSKPANAQPPSEHQPLHSQPFGQPSQSQAPAQKPPTIGLQTQSQRPSAAMTPLVPGQQKIQLQMASQVLASQGGAFPMRPGMAPSRQASTGQQRPRSRVLAVQHARPSGSASLQPRNANLPSGAVNQRRLQLPQQQRSTTHISQPPSPRGDYELSETVRALRTQDAHAVERLAAQWKAQQAMVQMLIESAMRNDPAPCVPGRIADGSSGGPTLGHPASYVSLHSAASSNYATPISSSAVTSVSGSHCDSPMPDGSSLRSDILSVCTQSLVL